MKTTTEIVNKHFIIGLLFIVTMLSFILWAEIKILKQNKEIEIIKK